VEEKKAREAAEEAILEREKVLAEGGRNGSGDEVGQANRHGNGHGFKEVEAEAMTMWNGRCCACE